MPGFEFRQEELAREAHVISVGRNAEGDDAAAHLPRFERFYHSALTRRGNNPFIVFNHLKPRVARFFVTEV